MNNKLFHFTLLTALLILTGCGKINLQPGGSSEYGKYIKEVFCQTMPPYVQIDDIEIIDSTKSNLEDCQTISFRVSLTPLKDLYATCPESIGGKKYVIRDIQNQISNQLNSFKTIRTKLQKLGKKDCPTLPLNISELQGIIELTHPKDKSIIVYGQVNILNKGQEKDKVMAAMMTMKLEDIKGQPLDSFEKGHITSDKAEDEIKHLIDYKKQVSQLASSLENEITSYEEKHRLTKLAEENRKKQLAEAERLRKHKEAEAKQKKYEQEKQAYHDKLTAATKPGTMYFGKLWGNSTTIYGWLEFMKPNEKYGNNKLRFKVFPELDKRVYKIFEGDFSYNYDKRNHKDFNNILFQYTSQFGNINDNTHKCFSELFKPKINYVMKLTGDTIYLKQPGYRVGFGFNLKKVDQQAAEKIRKEIRELQQEEQQQLLASQQKQSNYKAELLKASTPGSTYQGVMKYNDEIQEIKWEFTRSELDGRMIECKVTSLKDPSLWIVFRGSIEYDYNKVNDPNFCNFNYKAIYRSKRRFQSRLFEKLHDYQQFIKISSNKLTCNQSYDHPAVFLKKTDQLWSKTNENKDLNKQASSLANLIKSSNKIRSSQKEAIKFETAAIIKRIKALRKQ